MNLGYHVGDVKTLEAREFLEWPDADCYQIQVTPMNSLRLSSPDFDSCGETLVLHGPFVNSFLTNDDSKWERAYKYLADVTEYAIRNKIKYLCFHPGGIADNQTAEEGEERLKAFISRWHSYYCTSGVIFCLENKAGGPKDICTCSVLKRVLEQLPDCLNVAMALDTQHSWASGELKEVVEQWPAYRELVRVVHLNSVPLGNKYGGRKDSHSDTRLQDTDPEAKPFIDFFLQDGIIDARTPVILERDISLVEDDVLYIAKPPWE